MASNGGSDRASSGCVSDGALACRPAGWVAAFDAGGGDVHVLPDIRASDRRRSSDRRRQGNSSGCRPRASAPGPGRSTDRPVRAVPRQLARGNFGYSYVNREPVTDILVQRIPRTAALAFVAICTQLLIGIPLGLYGASRAGSIGDRAALGWGGLTISLPAFWVGLMLLYPSRSASPSFRSAEPITRRPSCYRR